MKGIEDAIALIPVIGDRGRGFSSQFDHAYFSQGQARWILGLKFGTEKIFGQICIIIRLKITLTDRSSSKDFVSRGLRLAGCHFSSQFEIAYFCHRRARERFFVKLRSRLFLS